MPNSYIFGEIEKENIDKVKPLYHSGGWVLIEK